MLMQRLAHFCYDRRRYVLVAWLLGLVLVTGLSRAAGGKSATNFTLPGTESQKTFDLLKQALSSLASNDAAVRAHIRFAVAQIDRFQKNPKEITLPKPLDAPPGQPIGCEGIE